MFAIIFCLRRPSAPIKIADPNNESDYTDLFSLLAKFYEPQTIDTLPYFGITASSEFPYLDNSQRSPVTTIVRSPETDDGRFLSDDQKDWPEETRTPWILIDFKTGKIEVDSFKVFYHAKYSRYMWGYTLWGEYDYGRWAVIKEVRDASYTQIDENDKYYRQHHNATEEAKGMKFRKLKITADKPCIVNNYWYKDALMVTLSKLLLWGTYYPDAMPQSPIRLERKLQYQYNYGVMNKFR